MVSSRRNALDTFKTSLHAGHTVEQVMQYPILAVCWQARGWQWVNLNRAGGWYRSVMAGAIRWHILVSFPAVASPFAPLWDGCSHLSLASPQLHLLSGATMLGAFLFYRPRYGLDNLTAAA